MKLRFISYIVLLALAAYSQGTAAPAPVSLGTYPSKPLDRVHVLALMDFGESSSRVVQLMRRAGIDFKPSNDDLSLFKELGASPALMNALETAKSSIPPASPSAEEQAASAHVCSCMRLALRGQFPDAEKECEAATGFEPAITYFALGNVLFRGRQLKLAVTAFKAAEKVRPDNPDNLTYLGLALAEAGKPAEAKKMFERAIQVDPEFETPYNNLAAFYLRQNDLSNARRELIRALQIDPSSASAHNNLAIVLMRQNDLLDAITELRKAAELDPATPFRHSQLAEALVMDRDYDGAVAEYRRALQVNPRLPDVHIKLAALLMRQNHPNQARSECQAAGQVAPDNTAVRMLCGKIYEQTARMNTQAAGGKAPVRAPQQQIVWNAVNLPAGMRGEAGEAAKQILAMKSEDFPALYDKATKGDAGSQVLVCIAYRLGHFVKQDDTTALDWCLKAAQQNNLAAEEDVGIQYAFGRGCPANSSLAIEWLKKAASQKSVVAMGNLGTIYANGIGVPQDYTEARKWYQAAADLGDPRSEADIGITYLMGQGVKADSKEGMHWIRKSEHAGYTYADVLLGIFALQGQGGRPNQAEAVKWFRKAATAGDPRAESELGWMYANGVGVPRDFGIAVKWYRAAAEQGDAVGAYGLGIRYMNGQGVERDYSQAEKWFRVAADFGHCDAAYNLALIYEARYPGQVGPADDVQAAKYFQIAAAQGIGDAQCALSGLYMLGKGVARDNVGAYQWALLATQHGTEQCGRTLQTLASQMTPEQIEQAQARAAAWKAEPHPAFNY